MKKVFVFSISTFIAAFASAQSSISTAAIDTALPPAGKSKPVVSIVDSHCFVYLSKPVTAEVELARAAQYSHATKVFKRTDLEAVPVRGVSEIVALVPGIYLPERGAPLRPVGGRGALSSLYC